MWAEGIDDVTKLRAIFGAGGISESFKKQSTSGSLSREISRLVNLKCFLFSAPPAKDKKQSYKPVKQIENETWR